LLLLHRVVSEEVWKTALELPLQSVTHVAVLYDWSGKYVTGFQWDENHLRVM